MTCGAAGLVAPADSFSRNVDTATREQLETLPGIGPARSVLIMRDRPYRSVDDLARVPGMRGQVLADIRPYVVVTGETRGID
ncbi:MAG: helix-hairpin-helix domain-containing protein [Steroidobacteraceae bacterium]